MNDRARQGYPFVVDGVEIFVPLSELVIVAAYRKSDHPATILGCTACETLCIERHRPCDCCSFAPSESYFSQGRKSSPNPGAHRVIPAAQLAEALALVRAA